MEWYKIVVIVFWSIVYILWSIASIKDFINGEFMTKDGDINISTVIWSSITISGLIIGSIIALYS